MIHEPEFVRGNQKSYIRIACKKEVFEGYEYQMCKHNVLNSFLNFQQRNQNGENYLYYEVSGLQSLDVFLQTQKLKKSLTIMMAKGIIKLCKELSEYALNLYSVNFFPKYIMVSTNGEEAKFLYTFEQVGMDTEGIEKLLECCIEHLDYKDELLMEQLYRVYENLLEQKENFSLQEEMEGMVSALSEQEQTELPDVQVEGLEAVDPFEEDKEEIEVRINSESKVAQKEYKNLKRGLWALLAVDMAALVLWRPLTILKIFFCVATGVILVGLNVHVYKQEKKHKMEEEEILMDEQCIEEYREMTKNYAVDNGGTQVVSMSASERVLYNLQNIEPKFIYFGDVKKIIGKDSGRVQVCIPHESVSRVHALMVKENETCIIEDLNSTNGTWVNGQALVPRTPCILKEGDKVRFAEIEYIFR